MCRVCQQYQIIELLLHGYFHLALRSVMPEYYLAYTCYSNLLSLKIAVRPLFFSIFDTDLFKPGLVLFTSDLAETKQFFNWQVLSFFYYPVPK